jgi:CRP-like cAMP-binding protein
MKDRKLDIRSYLDHVYAYLQRFVEISREEFDLLAPFLELRVFDKKTVILQQGDIDNYVNIVMKGMVRKYIMSRRGEATLQLATEGHIVQSEISFHTRRPSDVILETLEPTVLIAIRYDHMQHALDKIPGAEKLGRAIVTQMFIKKDMRYFEQLKMTTRERFLAYIQNHPHMMQRVPQKILASYLSIKPETFSRLKHLLRKK